MPSPARTRQSNKPPRMSARDVLVIRGPKAYENEYGKHPTLLSNNRLLVRKSYVGGMNGRGLFVKGSAKPGEKVLYGGEIIDEKEAKARKDRGDGDYIMALGGGQAAQLLDGKCVADAFSSEPGPDGTTYHPREDQEWVRDAGLGAFTNQDMEHPNAKMTLVALDELQSYRVIGLTRDLEDGTEILINYRRKGCELREDEPSPGVDLTAAP